jgi:arylsulfatase A-like enzyme
MLIVVTSDHGEAFGEHDGFGHHTMYEEILRVPLLVKWPGGERAGWINDSVSSSIDLAPTLLVAAGIDAGDLPGYDLHRRPADAPVFSGTLGRAVIWGNSKGIFGGAGPPRMFDLTTDPGEGRNIIESDPEHARVLRKLLADNQRAALQLLESFGSQRKSGEVALSDSERKRLEAFGYLQ